MKTLAEQVKMFMAWQSQRDGREFSAAAMAELVARHQSDLDESERCTRQNIETLLAKGFRTTRYLVALAKAMGTSAEMLNAGLYVPISDDLVITGDLSRDLTLAHMQERDECLVNGTLQNEVRQFYENPVSADYIAYLKKRPLPKFPHKSEDSSDGSRTQAAPPTLAQALEAIDAALEPLDAQARKTAVMQLAGLETPNNAGMVAATLSAAIEYSKLKVGAKVYHFPSGLAIGQMVDGQA